MASVEVIPIASVTDTRRFDLLPMVNRGFGSPGEVDDGYQENFREGERPIRWEKGAEEVKKTSLKPSSELSPKNSQKETSAISTVTDVFTEMTLNNTLPQTSQIGKGVTELTEWNPGDVTQDRLGEVPIAWNTAGVAVSTTKVSDSTEATRTIGISTEEVSVGVGTGQKKPSSNVLDSSAADSDKSNNGTRTADHLATTTLSPSETPKCNTPLGGSGYTCQGKHLPENNDPAAEEYNVSKEPPFTSPLPVGKQGFSPKCLDPKDPAAENFYPEPVTLDATHSRQFIQINANGRRIVAMSDTGSTVNFMSKGMYDSSFRIFHSDRWEFIK